jgi:aminoglycoside phosphotransferase
MTQASPAALSWAASIVDAKVVAVEGLRDGGGPWLLRLDGHERLHAVVLKTGEPGRDGQAGLFATEAAAMEVAEECALAAPRLLAADIDGSVAGVPALLSTVVPGRSRVPLVATVERLRGLGAAAASVHAVPMGPRPGLPLRTRSLEDTDFNAMRRDHGLSPLFEEAEKTVAAMPEPDGQTVLVHGDLWQGNTVFDGDTLTGLIDWDAAGVGQFGIDLGPLRLDTAMFFGQQAADEVLTGWRQTSGHPRAELADERTVAYWDVVAALCTPPDMAYWLQPITGQGRTDLTAAVINERRDLFLRTALDRLGR